MLRTATVVLAVLAAAGPALGQSGGRIAIYSDDQGFSDCNLVETPFSVNSVYVVHEMAAEGNTVQFKVRVDWPGAVAAGENYASNLHLGNPYTGVAVTYVGCEALPHLVARLDFVPMAETPTCGGTLSVEPDPAVPSGVIEVIDCSSDVYPAVGGVLTINGGDTCPCRAEIAEATWGRVKSLY
jgi:hypothetical protein